MPNRARRTNRSSTRTTPTLLRLRALLLLVAAAVGVSLPVHAATSGSSPAVTPPEFRLLEERADGMRLEFTLSDLAEEELSLPQGKFRVMAIPGGEEQGTPGAPMLPTCSRMLAVPAGVHVQVLATEAEFDDPDGSRGVRLLPMQEEDAGTFACDDDAYARDDWGDRPLVQVGSPAVLRGTTVVPLTVAPVQYNPARSAVRVARRIEIEVVFSGAEAGRRIVERSIPRTPSFARLFDAALINDPAKSATPIAPGTWLLICPDNPEVASRLAPLVEWRKRKGYPVVVATTSVAGTTKEQIKAYVQNAYDTWTNPPEFVVLAGDCTGAYVIPTWNETMSSYAGEGDHPYVLLEGNDILADANVGRLSFQTLEELETIVSKITNYEMQPYMDDTSWFTRACLTGDPIQSGISTVHTMQWIKSQIRDRGYSQIDTIFGGPWVSNMSTALNRGDTIFAYRGIYGMSGWTNGNTLALTNGWKLPYCVVITCDTGSFQYGTSRSEVFLRAGTPTTPKGGIGCVGTATIGTHTRYNNCYMLGNFWGLTSHDAWEMGAAHTWGKLNLWLNYEPFDYGAVVRFSYWNNLMGDPAAEVWTGVPQALAVTHPATIPIGSTLLPVDVASSGQPCADALVCLYQSSPEGEVQVSGYTDASGRANLLLPSVEAGPIRLTVSKHNRLPYLADVTAVSGELVGLESYTVDDDGAGGSQGNGNALANPAETIELSVQIRNFGAEGATAVTGRLQAIDPDVVVLHDVETFGDLAPGASAWGGNAFRFQVPPSATDGRALRFILTVDAGADSWESALQLPVSAVLLREEGLQLDDTDGNGRLDPGESGGLVIQLHNDGALEGSASTATLYSLSRFVDVIDQAGAYPAIPSGSSETNTIDPFAVVAHADCPAGHTAPMLVTLEMSDGSRTEVRFGLPIGELNAFDPTGPDQYGYYAYDDTDTGYPDAPVYNWREIAPAAGGNGTQVTLGDFVDGQDKSCTVPLPFPFRYYGRTYTTATICSNGWIQMGSTWLVDYRNWMLPSPGGPDGVIAPYWDDLLEVNATNAHVYQYYDAEDHSWIVEWYRMKNNGYSPTTETFELILFDPAWHPTESGDGIILFQYQNITNVDYVDGYSTVGIESPDNSDGLTYVYALRYGDSSAPLVSGRAFKFVAHREWPAAVAEPSGSAFGFTSGTSNPLAGGGALHFSLAQAGEASLSMIDAHGRMVRRLRSGPQPAGEQAAAWDGRDDHGRLLPAGVYFARLESAGSVRTRKFTLVR